MAPSNLAVLTRSHTAIAAKRRAKKDQIKEILFDDDARREFLTGFHKRKLAKADAARKKAAEREKQERLEARREQRRMLREQAAENAAQVERAYGAIIDSQADDDNDGDDWSGISPSKGKGRAAIQEEEYEDEELLATVTVVEDFDPDGIIHGPRVISTSASSSTIPQIAPTNHRPSTLPPRKSIEKSKKASKIKKVRYETKDARKVERTKQRARRTEKAELAGGKQGRSKRSAGGKSKGRGSR